MRRLVARGAIAAASSLSVACGFLIGLDDLPARPDASSSDSGSSGDGSARFCADAAGAYLCDDFDDPQQRVSAHWPGVPSLQLRSPGILREAGVAIVDSESATSPPSVLEATYYNDLNGLTSALLAAEFDGGVAAGGFVFSFDVQIPEMVNLHPDVVHVEDVGPDPALASQSTVAVGGFITLTDDFKRYGSLLGISKTDITLTEGVEGKVIDNYSRVAHVELSLLGDRGWLRIHHATGPRDRILALATRQRITPSCPADAPYLTLAWTSFLESQSGCVRGENQFSPVARGRQFALVLGVTSTDPFSARLRFDNVRLDPLP